MTTITDEQLINLVYQWNLSFFESRVKAGNRDEDIIRLKAITDNKDTVIAAAYRYLKYWKGVNPHSNPLNYVIDSLRDFMENARFSPTEDTDEYFTYNDTPVQY